MFEIRHVTVVDKTFWYTLDSHLNENEFELKVRDKRGYVISDGDTPVGLMRYNLFWDSIPFLTLIYFDEPNRRKGFGKQAMLHWEKEMRDLGHKMIMTSTQVDEEAQHFYRKLGYVDKGGLYFEDQPQELFMVKNL